MVSINSEHMFVMIACHSLFWFYCQKDVKFHEIIMNKMEGADSLASGLSFTSILFLFHSAISVLFSSQLKNKLLTKQRLIHEIP